MSTAQATGPVYTLLADGTMVEIREAGPTTSTGPGDARGDGAGQHLRVFRLASVAQHNRGTRRLPG